jgi:hypothetical protein
MRAVWNCRVRLSLYEEPKSHRQLNWVGTLYTDFGGGPLLLSTIPKPLNNNLVWLGSRTVGITSTGGIW